MIKLYDYELSGNCYKVRLFLNILGISYETMPVEFYPRREHKDEAFLRVNPLGQLPAISDGAFVLRDAQAILVYLAQQYDTSGRWYPTDDAQRTGETQMWLSFADGLTGSLSAARLHDLFFFAFDAPACRQRAHELLRVLDDHLWSQEERGFQYLCKAQHPTVADLACFPYIALSDEGGVSLADYPAIRRWTDRIKRLPRFVVMAGVFPTSALPVNEAAVAA